MALPTLEKTWEHKVNIAALGSATTLDNHQHYLWHVKEALINGAGVAGSFTTPWTVWGSSDSAAFGNNDGVDRWVATTDLVFNTGSNPHSWIVLKQTAIHANFQICIETNANGAQREFSFIVSPTAGFGVAGGGTDGSTTARPTATDERLLVNVGKSGVQYGAWDGYYHILMSDDGECTRVLLNRDGYITSFWLLDKPKSPLTAWTDASIYTCLGNSNATNHITRYGYYNDGTYMHGRIGSDPVSFYLTSDMYGSAMVGQNNTTPDDQTGEWPFAPMGLACPTVGHRGVRKGVLYDLWWGAEAVAHGSSYPDDASYQFAQFRDMIFPWSGAAPEV